MKEKYSNDAATNRGLQLKLARIYTRDISLEVPASFDALMQELDKNESGASFEPNLNFHSKHLSQNFYETTAHLKLTVKTDEMILYLLEVQLVGVFAVEIPQELETNALEQFTQAILFPHLSELVNDLSSRTSFPSINLINLLNVFDVRDESVKGNDE